MTQATAKIRLYVEADLGAGREVALGRDQAHYLIGVMRRGAGDLVGLFNGRDGEWLAEEGVECETIYCSDPPELQHSTLSQTSSSYVLDDVITYRCDVGYKVNDDNEYTSTCSEFAMWSVDSEQCQRKKIHDEKCT